MSLAIDDLHAGYQGSHRTGARVKIYERARLGGDISTYRPSLALHDMGESLELTQVSTQNVMGGGGTFQLSFRCAPDFDPLTYIDTDWWVDVSFVVDDVEWHTMRGLIDEIRYSQQATGMGTTIYVCNITGSSFQKCYASTPLFFNRPAGDFTANAFLYQNFGSNQVIGSPGENVRQLLTNLFEEIGNAGRANFVLPPGLPCAGRTFLPPTPAAAPQLTVSQAVKLNLEYFDDKFAPRHCPSGNQLYPDTDLWTMAMAFADLQYEELWSDLYPAGGYEKYIANADSEEGVLPESSEMTVMFRDKPFPVVTPDAARADRILGQSAFFTELPLHKVRRAEIQGCNLGVSSLEAFNAFLSCSALVGNNSNVSASANYPLWSPTDMLRRGMRRMDGTTMYSAVNDNLSSNVSLVNQLRAKLANWYALGSEYRQGSIDFACPKPGLRVGSRLEVTGRQPEDITTYYIEGVRHMWTPQGMHSQVDVTRGYTGSISEHLARLQSYLATYSLGTNAMSTVAPSVAQGTIL